MLAFKYNARLCNLLTSFNHRLAPLLIISVVQNVPFLICCVLGGGRVLAHFALRCQVPVTRITHSQRVWLINRLTELDWKDQDCMTLRDQEYDIHIRPWPAQIHNTNSTDIFRMCKSCQCIYCRLPASYKRGSAILLGAKASDFNGVSATVHLEIGV